MDNYVEYGVLSSDGSKCVNKSKKNKMIHYSHNQEGSILYAGVSAVSKLLKISEEEKVAKDLQSRLAEGDQLAIHHVSKLEFFKFLNL